MLASENVSLIYFVPHFTLDEGGIHVDVIVAQQ